MDFAEVLVILDRLEALFEFAADDSALLRLVLPEV